MARLIRSASILATMAAVSVAFGVVVNGCSSNAPNTPPAPSVSAEQVGNVGLELQLGPGLTLNQVNYTIIGPGGFTKSGLLDVSQSTRISGIIVGLPVGTGFTIALNGTTAGGGAMCLGSASFNVVALQTTTVAVHLTCNQAPNKGSINVNGTANVCPLIDGVGASPAEVLVGGSISLSASVTDADHGPSPLSYHWTTSSGTLSSASSPTPTLKCTSAGPVTVSLAVSDGDPASACVGSSSVIVTCSASPQLAQLGHVVVLYLENWSFDSLYGQFPGAEGLSSPTANIPQIDNATGMPYLTLPQVDTNIPLGLPNHPFDISQYVPATQTIHDLVHRFYQEQQQIDGGKMDKYVTVSDAKGLSFGYYPTAALPIVDLINSMPGQTTLLDHFFHAAFGGSFLNHQWLIAAASPVFPNAPSGIVASLDAQGNLITDGQVTPDGFVVNTSFTVNTPHPPVAAATLVPNQTNPTIGDRLSAAGVDWAWYSGGWNAALAGNPDPLFQFHHQPFAFYANYADGTAAKAAHLKDETDFVASIAAGTLPPVSFFKPLGPDNEHPGYATLQEGELHTVALIRQIMASPIWNDTVVIVTYDENGGFFDHVPPPVVDRWGPGTRVPAIVFSPFAKGGIDHTSYDTTAILKLIENRWGLMPLSTRDAAQNDLSANALIFASGGAGGSGSGGAGAGGASASGGASAGGAGGAGGGGGGAPAGGASGGAPTTAAVQAILNANCIGCHSGPTPPRGLDWTNVRAQIGVPAVECSGKSRISSGNASASYMIDKIMGHAQDGGCFSGARMPLNSPPLSAADIALIAAWINAGTPL